MIAKRVPRQGAHSNFRHLAEYILDVKHDGRKVAHAWTSNLSVPDDFQFGVIETQATQESNTRSKIDKTYHLVISLAKDEKLTAEQFKDVEQRFCQAIGLGDHHRICAIHKDTDHLHMHIAMSKVHPDTLNTIEPYYDKFKLQEVCRECEKIYNLQVDVGQDRSKRQNPVEVHQGLQSFQSWIKEHLRDELLALMKGSGQSWRDVQCLAGKYGLEVREHKTGFVFSHISEKLFVKASSVDRSFSKKSLEDRFGKFETAIQTVAPIMEYQRGPIGCDDKGKELYAAYQNEMTKIRADRKRSMQEQIDKGAVATRDIRARYARRRQQVRLDYILTRAQKLDIRRSLSAQMKGEIERHYKSMRVERRLILEGNITRSWQKWLQDQAKVGNQSAPELLQARSVNRLRRDSLTGRNDGNIGDSCGILVANQAHKSKERRQTKGFER